MNENQIGTIVLDAAFQVHRTLGPGLMESVYETVLAYELDRRLLRVRRQVPISIRYENLNFGEALLRDGIVRAVNGLPDLESPDN